MTAIICAIALSVVPAPADCQRGGHAVHEGWMERGGHALVVDVLPPIRNRAAWDCIHPREGSWTDTGDPYWGGLQMDRSFMAAYGPDFLREHRGQGAGGEGLADSWTPREQMIAADRAVASRGFSPWPQTARACGVL